MCCCRLHCLQACEGVDNVRVSVIESCATVEVRCWARYRDAAHLPLCATGGTVPGQRFLPVYSSTVLHSTAYHTHIWSALHAVGCCATVLCFATVQCTKTTTVQAAAVSSSLVEALQGAGFGLQSITLGFNDDGTEMASELFSVYGGEGNDVLPDFTPGDRD